MAVSEYEIDFTYRLLVGRVPAPEEVQLWGHVPSVADLRSIFLASDECRNFLRAQLPALNRTLLPADSPRLAIDVTIDPATEARLVAYIAQAWTALGQSEPHWSVLSDDAFKATNLEANAGVFYASGAADVAMIAAILGRHGLAPSMFPRMVEYGCGVGRVTPHLGAQFVHVLGIDISPSHLALAGQAVAAAGRQNISLDLARLPDFAMTAPFDLWFSRIVLQHNPPPMIAMVLRRMFAMLAAGGVAIFQVPTYVPGYRFSIQDYLAAPKSGDIEVHCLPQETVFALAHAAGCLPLEVFEDSSMGYPWRSQVFVFRKGG